MLFLCHNKSAQAWLPFEPLCLVLLNDTPHSCAGNDVPFVNNYGVWVDEFRDLGLEKNLNRVWEDALCYFGEGKEVRIGRQYGRVCRRRLRKHLLQQCQENGVRFLPGLMHEMDTEQNLDTATASIKLADGQVVRSRCSIVNLCKAHGVVVTAAQRSGVTKLSLSYSVYNLFKDNLTMPLGASFTIALLMGVAKESVPGQQY